jgi:hypothetical protein
LETKEYERNWNQKNTKEIGSKKMKEIGTKGYERNWKQKYVKGI